jgi:23S rRNA pseudouridine955/2504/2580 synthase
VGKTPATLHINKPLAKTFNKGFQRGITKIDTEEGKESITEAVCERSFVHPELGPLSLLKVTILTGRMHQIRAHLASEGFPVLGDLVYGNPKINRILLKTLKIKKVFLHCWDYSFWDIF